MKLSHPSSRTASISKVSTPKSPPTPKLPHSPPTPKLPGAHARPHLMRQASVKPAKGAAAPHDIKPLPPPKTKAAQWSDTPPGDWSAPSDAWEK